MLLHRWLVLFSVVVGVVAQGGPTPPNNTLALSAAPSAAPTASPTASPTVISTLKATEKATQARAYLYGFSVYGLNYNPRQGPDWDPNKCKDATQMEADLTVMQAVTDNVRLYSVSECSQARYVLQAADKLGMGVWLGLWVSGTYPQSYDDDLAELTALVEEGAVTETSVLGIHVGSEVLYRKEMTSAEIIAKMDAVKQLLATNGLGTIPVSIADIGDIYIQYPELMQAVDVGACNGFPFWESIEVDAAADYFLERFQPVIAQAEADGNKEIVITETGWPSAGTHADTSEASPANEVQYFADFACVAKEMGWRVFWFSGLDADYLKQQYQDDNTVEAHFGVFDASGQIKPDFLNMQIDCQQRR